MEREANDFLRDFCNGKLLLKDNEMSTILNSPITKEEVWSAISRLKKGKTPSLDGLPVEMIMLAKDIFTPHLVHIII